MGDEEASVAGETGAQGAGHAAHAEQDPPRFATTRLVKSKVLFTGLFLSPRSRRQLLAAFPAAHSNVHASHVILQFAPTAPSNVTTAECTKLAAFCRDVVGRDVEFRVVRIITNKDAQAAVVECPLLGTFCENAVPHITISTACGTRTKYSNEMLQSCITDAHDWQGSDQYVSPPLVLDARGGIQFRRGPGGSGRGGFLPE